MIFIAQHILSLVNWKHYKKIKLIIISLKELKVEYIAHHPIIDEMSELRIKLKIVEKKLEEILRETK